jgi:hypothetical protein
MTPYYYLLAFLLGATLILFIWSLCRAAASDRR